MPPQVLWTTPNSSEVHAGFSNAFFNYGLGGPCDRYGEQGGYVCSANASGGGFGWETMVPGAPLFPVGVSVPDSLFREPTKHGAAVAPPSEWAGATATGASPIVQTWTNGWATTMWEVGGVTGYPAAGGKPAGTTMGFTKGGQQTGRGFHSESRWCVC